MTTKGKIHYVPGLISLLILPILFIYFSRLEIRKRTIHALPLFLSSRDLPIRYPDLFQDYNGIFPPKRNYVDISMEGDDELIGAKLNNSKFLIKEILSNKDTVHGLRFRYGKDSKYWSFVNVIDILSAEKAKTFAHLEDDIYFYYLSSDTITAPYNIEMILCNDILECSQRESILIKRKKCLKTIWNSSSDIIIVFIGFLISVWGISKVNSSRQHT